MRVLVTGAAGFIGAAVSAALLARGDAVIGIDSLNDYYPVALKYARREQLAAQGGNRFAFEQLDFADRHALDAALAPLKFDRVVHLGAQAGVRYSIENPHAYVESNLVGHLNLLELSRHRGIAHMVYASSSSVYGANAKQPFSVDDRVDHPISLYAATKKAIKMGVSLAHQLVGLLGRGIQRERVIDPVVDRKRLLGVGAIDRRRAGIDHVRDAAMPREFEEVHLPDEVRLDIGVRVLERIAHPGLRTEMDDPVEFQRGERGVERMAVGEVELLEGEAIAAQRDQPVQPSPLQRDGIVVVEVVDADHRVTARE